MKILLVDDDQVMRMIVSDCFVEIGLNDIVEADDGETAWEKIASGLRPAICCCDILMPKLSGLDFLLRVRGTPGVKQMPFVMITAASDPDSVTSAITSGATGYVVKPFNPAEIRKRLRAIVASARELFAEDPAAVLRRMGVHRRRFLTYFDALEKELAGLDYELPAAITAGEPGICGARLDRLRNSFALLGLWHAQRIGLELAQTNEVKLAGTFIDQLRETVRYQRLEAANRLGL